MNSISFLKFSTAVSVALFLGTLSYGQQKSVVVPTPTPDFTGTWQLEKDRTTSGIATSPSDEGLTGNDVDRDAEVIVIAQNGPEITMQHTVLAHKQKSSFQRTYYVDGRGETNPYFADKQREIFSISKLRSRDLTIRESIRKIGSKSSRPYGTTEWILSKDNKQLKAIVRSEVSGLGLPFVITFTYKR